MKDSVQVQDFVSLKCIKSTTADRTPRCFFLFTPQGYPFAGTSAAEVLLGIL